MAPTACKGYSPTVFVMGVCMLALFCCFMPAQVFVNSLHGDTGAMTLIAICGQLLAPYVVTRVGAMRALPLLAFPGYVLFGFGVGYGEGWQVVAGGAACGISASMLWVAIPSVITASSAPQHLGSNNAMFFFLMRVSFVVNGVVGALLDSGVSMAELFVGVVGLGVAGELGVLGLWLVTESLQRNASARQGALIAPDTDSAAEKDGAAGAAAASAGSAGTEASEVTNTHLGPVATCVQMFKMLRLRHIRHYGVCASVAAMARAFSYSTLTLQTKEFLGESHIGHTSMVLGITLLLTNVGSGSAYDCLFRRGLPNDESNGRNIMLVAFVSTIVASLLLVMQALTGGSAGWVSYPTAVLIGVTLGTSEAALAALAGHITADKQALAFVLGIRTLMDGLGVVLYMLTHTLLPGIGPHASLVVAAFVAIVTIITWPRVRGGVSYPRQRGRARVYAAAATNTPASSTGMTDSKRGLGELHFDRAVELTATAGSTAIGGIGEPSSATKGPQDSESTDLESALP